MAKKNTNKKITRTNKITRTKERIKATGEIFTPLPLVDEILGKLDKTVWGPDETFLDPSCGDGNFLVRVVAWKIAKGSTPQQALSTTYGVELMEDNVRHARERVLIHAFAQLINNDLSYPDEDSIIQNRKYQSFVKKYSHIVERNIVCANGLTYDYSFSGTK